jgi:galactokinase
VDHRGGFVNVMAINREVLLAAAPRDDDVVAIGNLEPHKYPDREFTIFDLLNRASWTDWIDFVNSRVVADVLGSPGGDWSHYARAAMLRLQHECPDVRIKGMDCMVTGNIPVGAGLSSSSALVVAFAEATMVLNRLNVAMRDFVDLCGEGEWFAGSRDGSAEHAAIRTGRIGHISRIGFHPFRLDGEFRFPPDLRVVATHSGSQAGKAANARDIFNHRLACYDLGLLLLKRLWPAAAGVQHLQDMTPARLKVNAGEIYRALMRLPVTPSAARLRAMFPKTDREQVDRILATHASVGRYDLRGAMLYGLGELARSELFAEVVRRGDLDTIGRFMRTSHNGDRRVKFDRQGRPHRFVVDTSDAALERLAQTSADLTEQCGRYACSTEAIDHLVDIAESAEGVVGAQLAGAGLGGCMMIVVRADSTAALMRKLRQRFYRPRKLKFDAHVCSPVAGAGVLKA